MVRFRESTSLDTESEHRKWENCRPVRLHYATQNLFACIAQSKTCSLALRSTKSTEFVEQNWVTVRLFSGQSTSKKYKFGSSNGRSRQLSVSCKWCTRMNAMDNRRTGWEYVTWIMDLVEQRLIMDSQFCSASSMRVFIIRSKKNVTFPSERVYYTLAVHFHSKSLCMMKVYHDDISCMTWLILSNFLCFPLFYYRRDLGANITKILDSFFEHGYDKRVRPKYGGKRLIVIFFLQNVVILLDYCFHKQF